MREIIRRVRELGDRPVPERHHLAVLVVAIAIVTGLGVVMLLLRSDPRLPAEQHPPTPAVEVAPPPATQPSPQPPQSAGPVSATTVRAGGHAVRVFLRGHLPYTYGQAPASRIRRIAPGLRDQLAAHPPHAPARERHRDPRVLVVTVEQAAPRTMAATALIDDGARQYRIDVDVGLVDGEWRVTGL
jgi:hypothetical protein